MASSNPPKGPRKLSEDMDKTRLDIHVFHEDLDKTSVGIDMRQVSKDPQDPSGDSLSADETAIIRMPPSDDDFGLYDPGFFEESPEDHEENTGEVDLSALENSDLKSEPQESEIEHESPATSPEVTQDSGSVDIAEEIPAKTSPVSSPKISVSHPASFSWFFTLGGWLLSLLIFANLIQNTCQEKALHSKAFWPLVVINLVALLGFAMVAFFKKLKSLLYLSYISLLGVLAAYLIRLNGYRFNLKSFNAWDFTQSFETLLFLPLSCAFLIFLLLSKKVSWVFKMPGILACLLIFFAWVLKL